MDGDVLHWLGTCPIGVILMPTQVSRGDKKMLSCSGKCLKGSMDDLVTFRGSIFPDAHNRDITSMYKQAYSWV